MSDRMLSTLGRPPGCPPPPPRQPRWFDVDGDAPRPRSVPPLVAPKPRAVPAVVAPVVAVAPPPPPVERPAVVRLRTPPPLTVRSPLVPGLCRLEGCEDAPTFRGLCRRHYNAIAKRHLLDDLGAPARKAPPMVVDPEATPDRCRVRDCHKPHDSRGLCARHVCQARREGALDRIGIRTRAPKRPR